MLQVRYQGRRWRTSAKGTQYTETWHGTHAEIEEFETELAAGSTDRSGRYRLVDWERRRADGPYSEIELKYENYSDASGNIVTGGTGPNQDYLDISVMFMPLESHPDYRVCWNYDLAALEGAPVPGWWKDKTKLKLTEAEQQQYRWVKNFEAVYSMPKVSGKSWVILEPREMPGVEAYVVPTYTLRETTQHTDKAETAWAVRSKAAKIVNPVLGAMGLKDISWLCYGGTVNPDGRKVLAAVTYKGSPDPKGWSDKLYKKG